MDGQATPSIPSGRPRATKATSTMGTVARPPFMGDTGSMITGIGHVAFRVTDLGRALDFYCGTLGFREAFRLERDGEPSPWIVYLQLAPGQFLELFPGGTGAVAPRSRGPGYNHYFLVVD